MADSDHQTNSNGGFSATITLQITIAIVVLNSVLFLVICFLYFRSKGYFCAINSSLSPPSRRLIFVPHEPTLPQRALDPSILSSLPITTFRSEDFKGGMECAVCLCELTDGEEARLLSRCNHGFHVECIDMWFHSNSTCPLCRKNVHIESSVKIQMQPLESISESGHPSDIPSSSCSSGKGHDGMLAIDIPRRMPNGFSSSSNSPFPMSRMSPNSPLPTSRLPAEGVRSPALGRMRSLRRMLSKGNGKGTGPSSSPRGTCDVEQGGAEASKCQ